MSPSASSSPAREKVLIIEGNAGFAGRLSDLLKREGYTVLSAATSAEGIKAMYDSLPHLVLLDVVLSDADGYTVLAKKQSEPLLAKIPVFLMSTQGSPINMRSVPQGSVAEFIVSMEVSPADIVARVNSRFGRKSAAEISAAATAIAPDGGPTIVWVEDDKLIGTILAKKFISSGFHLIQAANGEEALAHLATIVPDAIVLDILMPGMSGFDILQKIKMDKRLDKVPSMILSNLSRPSDIEKAKMLGAQKFVVKAAASLDQIVAEVKDLCKTGKSPKVLFVS